VEQNNILIAFFTCHTWGMREKVKKRRPVKDAGIGDIHCR